MSSPNTLIILSKHGLKLIDKKGICESSMWALSDEEETMKYLSLHRSKSDRAFKGGEILGVREATDEEIIEHHKALNKSDPESAPEKTKSRKIITFQIDRGWHALWPEEARKNPMAHKGIGHVAYEAETE